MDTTLPPPRLTRRRKAALIVQMLIDDGGQPALSTLPESLQKSLAQELGAVNLVDKGTVAAVANEFVAEIESVGLTAPGTTDRALRALSAHLSPGLAQRLQDEIGNAHNNDPWQSISAMPADDIAPMMLAEATEVCAVVLSKLPVALAADVLVKTPGDRARRVTFAMSQTADVAPDTVNRIGAALLNDYGGHKLVAFKKPPFDRLGAILNATPSENREDVLDGLGAEDPAFAGDVRRAIFTFKDIAHRVAPTDVATCIRAVDADTLSTALAAALAQAGEVCDSAEYILANISQRMAGQMREDADERGAVKKADAETAMTAVTTAIRGLVDAGTITFKEPAEADS